MAAVDEYYRDFESREDYRDKLYALWEIKSNISWKARESSDEKLRAFYEDYCDGKYYSQWSFADLVRATGLAREELEALVAEVSVHVYPHKTVVYETFPIDYDLLYGELLDSDASPLELERRLCGLGEE